MGGRGGRAVDHDPPPSTLAPTVWFIGLAYALSWAWWMPLAMSGSIVETGRGWPTHLPGLAGPAVAALLVTAATDGRSGLADLGSRIVRWRIGARWYGVVALTLLAAVVPLAFGTELDDLLRYPGAPTAGIVVIALVAAVNGLGEEIGWRGLLVDRLLSGNSLARSALIVWPIWALWHLPLFWINANFRDFGVFGTIGWAVGIGFGSVFLTWLYRSSTRSILLVALWHGAYNLATATDAASGAGAALVTAGVIAASVVVMRRPTSWVEPSVAVGGRN